MTRSYYSKLYSLAHFHSYECFFAFKGSKLFILMSCAKIAQCTRFHGRRCTDRVLLLNFFLSSKFMFLRYVTNFKLFVIYLPNYSKSYSFKMVGTGALSSDVWSTGAQLMIFFSFRFPVGLFGSPGISKCHATHCTVSVESFSLLRHSIKP